MLWFYCFFTLLVREKKIGKTILGTVLSVLISLIAICVLVELFTFGHLKEWYGSVFGTGGYQSWYYDTSKSYFLFDVDFSFLMMLQACIVVYICSDYGKNREKSVRLSGMAYRLLQIWLVFAR